MFENDMKLPKMENVRERPLYDYVLDYIKSRNFNVTLSKYYEKLGTINCGDPYILLDDAKETLRKTEKNLSKQRKRQEEKRKVIVKEYELFEEKEKIFRNNFLRFDKFIKENREKRERGNIKMEEEKLLIEKRQHDTEEIQESYKKFFEIKLKLEEGIKKHNIYQKFLLNCCNESDSFSQPVEMLECYEILLVTRNVLIQKQANDLIALENAKANLDKLADEKNMLIIGLNTKIFGLEARYENSRYRSLVNENLIMDIFERAAERISEIASTKQTILHMFVEMNKAKNIKKSFNPEDYETQLANIKGTLSTFYKMNKYFRKFLQTAKPPNET